MNAKVASARVTCLALATTRVKGETVMATQMVPLTYDNKAIDEMARSHIQELRKVLAVVSVGKHSQALTMQECKRYARSADHRREWRTDMAKAIAQFKSAEEAHKLVSRLAKLWGITGPVFPLSPA